MKTLIALGLLLASTSLLAQQAKPLRVGQHSLGESTGEFLKVEPKFAADLDSCRQHPKKNKEWCLRLNTIFVQHSGYLTGIGRGLGEHDAIWWTWSFAHGQLLKMELQNVPFTETVADLTQRLGKPEEVKEQLQNGYGARWERISDHWLTNDVHAVAMLNPAPGNAFQSLVVETRGLYDQESARKQTETHSPIN